MPLSPYWKNPFETEEDVPRVPMRPREPMPEPAPPPVLEDSEDTEEEAAPAPVPNERARMREFLRKRYPDEFNSSMGEFERARVTSDDLANAQDRASDQSFIGALSSAAAGIGNYGGKASKTDVPDYVEGVNDRNQKALSARQGLADSESRRMGQAIEGMDRLDAQDRADALRPLEDKERANRLESQDLDIQGKRKSQATEAEKADPNSEASRTMRSLAKERWKKVFGSDLPDNISASALEKYMPEVAREFSRLEERDFRRSEGVERRRAQEEHDRRWTEDREADRRSREGISRDAREARAAEAAAKPPKPLTEGQANAATFAERMEAAEREMDALEGAGYKRSSGGSALKNTVVPEGYLSENDKRQKQAERNFITSVLRKESGASISPTEFDTAAQVYFPRHGDTPEVLRQKKEARRTAINGMRRAAASGGETAGAPPAANDTSSNTTPAAPKRRVWKPGG